MQNQTEAVERQVTPLKAQLFDAEMKLKKVLSKTFLTRADL